jgi:hypothetical protein
LGGQVLENFSAMLVWNPETLLSGPVIRPHASGYIEFADELERIVSDIGASRLLSRAWRLT